ncbi:MAG: site-specific integrase [Actinomycetota bacterium]|nr:site-specific integrase [Actinomycetota bacterium]
MSGVRDGVIKRGATWSFVIRAQDPETGRSRPRWVGGFPTEAAAKAARDEARVAARRGEYVDRTRLTVAEYLREWLAVHAVAIKPKTLAGYREDIERYVIPRLGGQRLQALRPATLTRFYRDLLESGGRDGRPLSPRTVDHVHRTLRKALGDAVRVEQLLPSNPAERATRPRGEFVEPADLWTPGELRRFLEAAARHRLGAFYWLAAYTGARRGELLALRWTDIDLDGAAVTFAGSTDVIGGRRVDGTTKGGRSRTISIDAETAGVLREHRKDQAAERLKAGPLWTGSGLLVFTTETGTALYPDTVSALTPTLARRADLTPMRLHDLRHLHATTLLLAGVPVHVVANRLGHRDPAITLRVYAHVLREQTTSVAEVFATALRG